MDTILALLIVSIITTSALLYLYIKKTIDYKELYARYKDVIDIEKEKTKVRKQYEKMVKAFENKKNEFDSHIKAIRESYIQKKNVYEKLLKEISIFEDDIEFISYGIYKPHFDFDTPTKYKIQMNKISSLQKDMIRRKEAAVCSIVWAIGGSKTEGRKMTVRFIKLLLRAFNNECDSAILKVKWNNVLNMEARINKAFVDLNRLGEPNQIRITNKYLQSKLDELHLAHEYQEKLYEEKEEQRRIREQMREEEKVQKEIAKAQIEAEQEEKRYEKALEQAKRDIEKSHGAKLIKLTEHMKLLEAKLKEAQEIKERAVSRAQLTKSGHVYIISNIGSFGNKVLKIGMSRRLEPSDRVRELGDASVPFSFDIHAMIYSKDAPQLESALHKVFDKRRLNLVNQRKEFFYATLEEVEKVVKKYNAEIEFIKIAEAKEYRESLAIRGENRNTKQQQHAMAKEFPVSI